MGMYDTLICEFKLPDKNAHGIEFQTKDLACELRKYKITKEGQLIWLKDMIEIIPESNRPWYGKPEWNHKDIFKRFDYQNQGSEKFIETIEINVNYNGRLDFYGSHPTNSKFQEYSAIFVDNICQSIGKTYQMMSNPKMLPAFINRGKRIFIKYDK